MKSKWLFLWVFVFLISGHPVFSLTWHETRTLAEKNNPELTSAQKQVAVYQGLYQRALTSFLPQISANLSTGASSPGDTRSYSYGLTASQPIFKGLANWLALEAADSDYHFYQASLNDTLSRVFYEVRTAFIDLLMAQSNRDLQNEILARRRNNARLIALRYQSGKEDRGNLLRTQADVAAAEYSLSSAERDLRLKRNQLRQLLGQEVASVEENPVIAGSSRPDFEALLKKTPSFQMAEYQFQSALISQRSTISEFLPSVSLSASYRKSGSSWPPDGDNNSWSLNLSYPFFPGGANLVDVKINNLKLEKSRADREKTVRQIRYQLETDYENFQDSVEALEVSKIYLAAAEERSKISQSKYLNGLMTYDEWDRIETELISSQKNLLNSNKSALQAEAAWQNSYGSWVK